MVDTRRAVLTLIALLLAGGGLGVALYRYKLLTPAPEAAPISVPAPAAEKLPPLEQSDVLVRTKASALSAKPIWLAWLDSDDLLRRAAAAVDLVGRGLVPKDALVFMAPRGKFAVAKAGASATIDPRSYARYDETADVIGSIDPAAAARVFNELEPLLKAACREFERDCEPRAAFGRAAKELLDAPVLEGPVALKPSANRLQWAFADERLERLSPAQKQLLRMGPRNADKVRGLLRAVAQAAPLPLDVPAGATATSKN